MDKVTIEELRYLQLIQIEKNYYANFEKFVKTEYLRYSINNIHSMHEKLFNRELQQKIEIYLNRKIRKASPNYPTVNVTSGCVIMYYDINGKTKTVHT